MDLSHWGGFDAAIVDLDGTLVDTVGDFELALGAALRDLGYAPVSRAFISRTVGKGTEHLIRRTLAEAGAPEALYETANERYREHYLRINGQASTVYPGAAEGVAALKARGLKLACVTNKPAAFAKPLLIAKGLSASFDITYGGDAFERKKPDPLPLLKACEALGTTPARTLMIGDSQNDAQAARAAGCPVVLVRYGYNHGEPVEAAGADAVVDRIDELQSLLA
ncbi:MULTISPECIES: phosphoglycolate phosphatase [Rubrivivax]|uniref:Phosphoglycolate phosphatase n=1 Tax=Rubrivivax benzoatilyticus TaxID=316997 RepID=A0ABX0HZH1_9BURK|nr:MULTISPECIES: phosphoglycolate phosphatase [Rubrivivax]EGJ09288.1 phosphoglycolate phosphatase [Rubrivivax benzoatilyticus JA2 = ATCC BAA-35]MCC9596994.1 phosphoglycolate phosphatase [Rubrivivax sp. JA1055]MCC9649149.1 phosphoglycolate phosphatase [Rubrivivax sp. JA1029]NHL00383.1 phosphoglycolate phosphatase [Rubrivivax benzoatilyticus]NHL26255.1 phosphoglycolate phosphatase [Rubrivivax benzoatilyticus]